MPSQTDTVIVVPFLMVSLCYVLAVPVLDQVLKVAQPVTSILDLKGGSKLSLFNMLTNSILKTPGGDPISEGDIVKPSAHPKSIESGDIWPNAVVPYTYHPSVDEEHKYLISEAMKHWEEQTCLRFRPKKPKDRNLIRFRTDTAGCWSSVGRQFFKPGPQDISLGAGCFKFYTAVHEIGHTIGYYHEHARKDRDSFIHIAWEDLMPGMDVQFEHKNTLNELEIYDYRSIMHYPAWAFSKAPLKRNVILSKNPFLQYLIDEEKESLSFRDIKLTNHLYKCNEKCSLSAEPKCENQGYLSLKKGTDSECFCRCPPGHSGDSCQIVDKSKKVDATQPKCGGYITKEGTFMTPNYPERKNEFESCTYWIRAPAGQRTEVTFEDFSIADPFMPPGSEDDQGLCLYESVEIRLTNDIYLGSIYCGEQIAPNTIMTSEKRDFIIIIIADSHKRGRGLKAKVNFIEGLPENTAKGSKKKNKSSKNSNSDGLTDVAQGLL